MGQERSKISLSITLQKEQERNDLFVKIQSSMTKGLRNVYSKVPQKWMADHALTSERTGAGFNSGQLHFDGDQKYKDALIEIGFRKYSRKNSNGVDGFKTFGNYGILFPLKNAKGRIVNFYAIRIKTNPEEHSLLNQEGIYPAYPNEMTTRLFIATDILDAATLIECNGIQNRDSLIFIPDGKILKQHEEAIKRLSALQSIIWIDNNKNQVNMKDSANQLKSLIQRVPLRRVVIPEKENLNQIFLREGSAGVQKLLESSSLIEEVTEVESTPLPITPKDNHQEEEVVVFSPTKETVAKTTTTNGENKWEENVHNFLHPTANGDTDFENPKLEVLHEHKIVLRRPLNNYYVLGTMVTDIGSMRITIMVEEAATGRKERTKIDLYEREQIVLYVQQISELYNQPADELESDMLMLTDLLEKFREAQLQQVKTPYQGQRKGHVLTPEKQSDCIQFLKGKNFMKGIDELIQQAGVVGEESTRRLLFVIASTYKMSTPLHALVQGTSGSGKSHLINTIGDCFPPEDVISMTRVTSKSFYHYTKDELVDKLILIQDYDGLDEEAQFAFRELQSAGNISSSTTYKDRYGNLMSAVKTVRSHFASLLATTKAEVYYDNMSRSMISGVDESDEQTKRIITHQNRKLAGIIDNREERKAKEFLQNCMRCIMPLEVVNPYADKVYLPFDAKMLRRLNSHYQAFVKQITILHQYQRKRDDRGRLIAEPEDLKIACEILFDAIMLKVDDLDSSLRQFYNRMKEYVMKLAAKTKEKEFTFTQRDVRLALNISKTQCFRYFEELELLEYIQRTGGYANRGFKYKVVFWDEMEKIRERVMEDLKKQLVAVGSEGMEHQNPHKQGE
ncbi:MAG: ATP-binding protein [Bacteroidetes bacterium]|nr:ATP-binding protein [Bacteroidota bacterium]